MAGPSNERYNFRNRFSIEKNVLKSLGPDACVDKASSVKPNTVLTKQNSRSLHVLRTSVFCIVRRTLFPGDFLPQRR